MIVIKPNTSTSQKFETVTLFVMTKKGLAFIEQALKEFRPLIQEVVIGRDLNLTDDYSGEISRVCTNAKLPHCFREDFKQVTSKYVMAISWRWLINHPSQDLIVFHDSLLPKYRGFAPLVNALINGETKLGVTALYGASEYDSGDIIHQSSIDITYPITISSAIELIIECYVKSGLAVLTQISDGKKPKAEAQDSERVTYSIWRDDEDYRVNWNESAAKIRRTIDALGAPYKGALTLMDSQAVRITAAEELTDVAIENRTPGKIIFMDDGFPIVVCGEGLLMIKGCSPDGSEHSIFPLKKFRQRFG